MSQDHLPLVMLITLPQIVNFADAYRIESDFLNHITDLFGEAFFRMDWFLRLTIPANVVECQPAPEWYAMSRLYNTALVFETNSNDSKRNAEGLESRNERLSPISKCRCTTDRSG